MCVNNFFSSAKWELYENKLIDKILIIAFKLHLINGFLIFPIDMISL
jgi:hypothetical protein